MGDQWFRVDDQTYRMKVEDGWLYKDIHLKTMVFVPSKDKDKQHYSGQPDKEKGLNCFGYPWVRRKDGL